VVNVTHLDKSTCELATQFNNKRFSYTVKCARQVIKATCLAFQNIKNFMRDAKKAIVRFFSRFTSSTQYSYLPLLEEKLRRIRGEIFSITMEDLLAVPETTSQSTELRLAGYSQAFAACGIPLGFPVLR
jgi:hypothetical protein